MRQKSDQVHKKRVVAVFTKMEKAELLNGIIENKLPFRLKIYQ